jgi:hypothetical protein
LCSSRRGGTAAQVFEQQDHLVLLIPAAVLRTGLLVFRYAPGQLGAGTAGVFGRLQDAAAQKPGDELQFVRRQAEQETASAGLQGPVNTRNQGGYQTAAHGRSPVEKPYQILAWIWPYYGENRPRVQGG